MIHYLFNMDLFNQDIIQDNSQTVNGLEYHKNFISNIEHKELLQIIDNQIWLDDLKRRVQHYGYKYDYKRRSIDKSMLLGEIPEWCKMIGQKIIDKGIIDFMPDQVIVNEYLPGQGIANHIDCEPCFNDTVVSLSLASRCIMQFTNKINLQEIIPILLEPCSLVVLKQDSRYNWMHGIKAVKTDNYNGQKIVRNRRVSLTFRKVIIN
jgi:alkylated DNA repair dioxygenase AlkB